MDKRDEWSGKAMDPLVLQAQTILAQRLARLKVIDPDLLGEPGWDILLMVFIATGKGNACKIDTLGGELGLSEITTARWVAVLAERNMLEVDGNLATLSDKTERTMRVLFSAQLDDLLHKVSTFPPLGETSD